jgi:hypothetical protein
MCSLTYLPCCFIWCLEILRILSITLWRVYIIGYWYGQPIDELELQNWVHKLHDSVLSKYFELSVTSLIYINVSWFFSDSIFAKLTLHRKRLSITSGILNLCALLRCLSTINLLAEKLFKMLVSRVVMSINIFFPRH